MVPEAHMVNCKHTNDNSLFSFSLSLSIFVPYFRFYSTLKL